MKETFTLRRHRRGLDRVTRRLEHVRERIEQLRARKEAHALTPAQYTKKKAALDNRFRSLSARERTLKGALAQERVRVARRTRKPEGATAR